MVFAADLSAEHLMAGLRAGHNWIAESSTVQLSLSASAGTRHTGLHRVGIGETLRAGTATPVTVEVTVDGAAGTVLRLCTQHCGHDDRADQPDFSQHRASTESVLARC